MASSAFDLGRCFQEIEAVETERVLVSEETPPCVLNLPTAECLEFEISPVLYRWGAESWKGPGTAKYDSSPVDFM
jgi:hypothetical protein